jgi:hypothetical protein
MVRFGMSRTAARDDDAGVLINSEPRTFGRTVA